MSRIDSRQPEAKSIFMEIWMSNLGKAFHQLRLEKDEGISPIKPKIKGISLKSIYSKSTQRSSVSKSSKFL